MRGAFHTLQGAKPHPSHPGLERQRPPEFAPWVRGRINPELIRHETTRFEFRQMPPQGRGGDASTGPQLRQATRRCGENTENLDSARVRESRAETENPLERGSSSAQRRAQGLNQLMALT